MGQAYPEVVAQKDFIKNVVREEENTFLRTLTSGIKKLEQITEDLAKTGEKTSMCTFYYVQCSNIAFWCFLKENIIEK